jgi:hypothetical protein
MDDDFALFEHEAWQRVADKYDCVWSSLARQFIPYLLTDAKVTLASRFWILREVDNW